MPAPVQPAPVQPAEPSRATLLIDLDGTLVDTIGDLAAALNHLLLSEDLAPLPETTVRRLVGRGAPRLVEWGLETAGAQVPADRLPLLVRRFLDVYEAEPAVLSRPYPGVPETLAAWRAAGHRLAVCTNKPQAASERILADLGLAHAFEAVGGGDRFGVHKPDGRHLHETLALAGGTAERAVMIGDSRTDLEAARDAGVPVVLVDYGYSAEPVHTLVPDRVASTFDALPNLVSDLLRALEPAAR